MRDSRHAKYTDRFVFSDVRSRAYIPDKPVPGRQAAHPVVRDHVPRPGVVACCSMIRLRGKQYVSQGSTRVGVTTDDMQM